MSSRKLWILAALGDLTAGLLSFVVHGLNAGGAGSATRNTARFAICFLLVGFASPGLRKWWPTFPEPVNLIRAYMAAQFVHFVFVANLHTTFAREIQIGLPQIAISVLGFSLVALTGYSAGAVTRAGIIVNTLLLYLNWGILAADYSSHPSKRMRFIAVPVFLAWILRQLPKPKPQAASAAGA